VRCNTISHHPPEQFWQVVGNSDNNVWRDSHSNAVSARIEISEKLISITPIP
jgi:hypothetical protein